MENMKNTNIPHFIQLDHMASLVGKIPRKESIVSREDFERMVLPGLQRMAVDRLDELARSTMTTQGLTSYPAALAIVKKENPDLVRMAYTQPSKFMADLSGDKENI
jgi:hypothetical protein